ncbi:hypothetical protein GIB19_24765 [Pseudomonas sp. ITEM 17296]|uniref:hypothetical protein n=1 Tax=Pseudomonas sp. ITEM 17296 TaxID=2790281 RepID=UPI0023800C0F|nr:hypothetical protein [Pseudomonas sp. ITEM 17296]MDE4540423.1 hypothetical protein [Pseudomonas sp. ITEM 17296]
MYQPISESQFETLFDRYIDVLVGYLDDLSEGAGSADASPWFSCFVPDAIYELVSVAGIRDKLSIQLVEKLWHLAARNYSRLEIFQFFYETIGTRGLSELHAPIMVKIARKSPELEAGSSLFDLFSVLGSLLYSASLRAEEVGCRREAVAPLLWGDFNQALLRKLVFDGHLGEPEQDLLLSRDLGL